MRVACVRAAAPTPARALVPTATAAALVPIATTAVSRHGSSYNDIFERPLESDDEDDEEGEAPAPALADPAETGAE